MTESSSTSTLPVANGHDPASALLTPEQKAKKNARQRANYALNKEKHQAWNKERAEAKREWYLANLERIRLQRSSPEWREDRKEKRNAKRRTDPATVERERGHARTSYERHREKRIAYAKAYHEQNRDTRLVQSRQHYQANKEDYIRKAREWEAKNPDKVKASSYAYLKRNREQIRGKQISRFGLTYEEYLEILTAQHGVCAICKNPERMTVKKTGRVQYLCVDHDHSTGEVRGLLCGRCNIAIGMFGDDPATVFGAWEYLSKHKAEEE